MIGYLLTMKSCDLLLDLNGPFAYKNVFEVILSPSLNISLKTNCCLILFFKSIVNVVRLQRFLLTKITRVYFDICCHKNLSFLANQKDVLFKNICPSRHNYIYKYIEDIDLVHKWIDYNARVMYIKVDANLFHMHVLLCNRALLIMYLNIINEYDQ